jgi:acyl-CoA synthetase (AMP-forming)/AMP-acid ligase II
VLVGSRALVYDPGRDEKIAVRGTGGALTYAQLRLRASRIAEEIARWWDSEDRRSPFIAVLSGWTPEFIATFLGLTSAGLAVGICDPAWSETEVTSALEQLHPFLCLVADDRAAHGPALAHAGWRAVGRIDPGWSVRATRTPPAMQGPAPADPDGPFYAGFTSGSTGQPKTFVRTHRSWWESFERLGAVCSIDAERAVLVPGPLSSSHFLFGALHALHAGATVEILEPARLPSRLAEADPVAAMYVVPTMLTRLAEARGAFGPGPEYIFCAGASLSPDVAEAARRRFPRSRLVEYYGASELSFVAIRRDGDGTPAGSVGRAFPGVEISVRDDGDVPVAPGVEGTIFARSSLIFSGYRGEVPASAARRIADGWWTVGDRGSLDKAGNLYVVGRGSSLIVTGGANVQPEEVEQVVAGSPGVAACVVVGLPDPTWGEIVCAAVVAEPDVVVRRDDLRRCVAGALAPYKRPRRYIALEGPLPLGRTGKVDRVRVRALVMRAGSARDIR